MLIQSAYYTSIVGELLLASYGDSLCMCDWISSLRHTANLRRVSSTLKAPIISGGSQVIDEAMRQLDEYFSGLRREFDLPLLYPGTEFQQKVWRHLIRIPYSCTETYKDCAMANMRPTAVRAVANAIGANALSIVIPCHRVIGADGSLKGYAGGMEAKRFLLSIESGSDI